MDDQNNDARAALAAQQVAEPFAYMDDEVAAGVLRGGALLSAVVRGAPGGTFNFALYTHAPATPPRAAQPQGEPSDEQIKEAVDAIDWSQMVTADDYPYMIARAVLALRQSPVPAPKRECDECSITHDPGMCEQAAPAVTEGEPLQGLASWLRMMSASKDVNGGDYRTLRKWAAEVDDASRAVRVPMTDELPSVPGIYAWVAGNAAALVLVNKRPSEHAPGGQFNGHIIQSTRFYDGCAAADWGRDGKWTLLHAHGITQPQQEGPKP